KAAGDASGPLQGRSVRVIEGRVVELHLQVGTGSRQGVEQVQVTERAQLVDQYAHLYTPPRRLDQPVQHHQPNIVVIPDIRLDVHGTFGCPDQVEPRHQGGLAVGKQAHHVHGVTR